MTAKLSYWLIYFGESKVMTIKTPMIVTQRSTLALSRLVILYSIKSIHMCETTIQSKLVDKIFGEIYHSKLLCNPFDFEKYNELLGNSRIN